MFYLQHPRESYLIEFKNQVNNVYGGLWAFQVALVVKNPRVNAGDAGLIPGSRRSPGVGHGNPFQYSCLENLMDRGAWRATAHRVTKNQNDRAHMHGGLPSRYGMHYACLLAQSCPALCEPLNCSYQAPSKNTEVGSHSLLQQIFLIRGSKLSLLHCRWILYCLNYQGSPDIHKHNFNTTLL